MSLPQHMRADDPVAADPARRRLLQKPTFPRFPSFPSRPSSIPSLSSLPLPSPSAPSTDDIHISNCPFPLHQDRDLYRWAVLYENQRGITLFSTPYYSALSLLPIDPPPYTALHARDSRSILSLDNYPLPDGTWRWVSSAWMVDMRTHLGDVQHDGFEYNWSFRDHHWHAQIGKLSAGAWVRRRRWVRLMMRPASHTYGTDGSSSSLFHGNGLPTPAISNLFLPDIDPHVWDGSEQDWQHVHRLLRQLGRDGRKLELWRTWLAPYAQMSPLSPKGKARQFDAPTNVTPQEPTPPLNHLTTILGNHGEAILRSFVFPDSRAQFVSLLRQAGLAKTLASCLGRDFSVDDLDFWSYVNERLD